MNTANRIRKIRLDELAEQLKRAKTDKERDRISKEINKAIGFDEGEYDPEKVGEWERANGQRTD